MSLLLFERCFLLFYRCTCQLFDYPFSKAIYRFRSKEKYSNFTCWRHTGTSIYCQEIWLFFQCKKNESKWNLLAVIINISFHSQVCEVFIQKQPKITLRSFSHYQDIQTLKEMFAETVCSKCRVIKTKTTLSNRRDNCVCQMSHALMSHFHM